MMMMMMMMMIATLVVIIIIILTHGQVINVCLCLFCLYVAVLNNLTGMDRLVRLWNPYVTTKPVGRLRGHNAPVCYLCIVGSEKRLYSVSTDRCIKVLLTHNLQ